VELLVHRLLDLRQLGLVAVAHFPELAFQHASDTLEMRADLLALLALLT